MTNGPGKPNTVRLADLNTMQVAADIAMLVGGAPEALDGTGIHYTATREQNPDKVIVTVTVDNDGGARTFELDIREIHGAARSDERSRAAHDLSDGLRTPSPLAPEVIEALRGHAIEPTADPTEGDFTPLTATVKGVRRNLRTGTEAYLLTHVSSWSDTVTVAECPEHGWITYGPSDARTGNIRADDAPRHHDSLADALAWAAEMLELEFGQ